MTLYPPLLKRGITLMPSLILIPQWAKGNAAYLAHEMVHVDQQWAFGTLTFWRRYLFDKAFRQTREVEAYKAQIAAGASLVGCATSLATEYRLDLTTAQAMALLEKL